MGGEAELLSLWSRSTIKLKTPPLISQILSGAFNYIEWPSLVNGVSCIVAESEKKVFINKKVNLITNLLNTVNKYNDVTLWIWLTVFHLFQNYCYVQLSFIIIIIIIIINISSSSSCSSSTSSSSTK